MKTSCKTLNIAAGFSRIFCRKFHRSSKFDGENETIISNIYNRSHRGIMDPRNRRVVVTGSGMISPMGCHITEVFDKVINKESGISKLEDENFDYGKLGVHYAGRIHKDNLRECDEICQKDERIKSTAMKYAEFAAVKALEDVGKKLIILLT